MHQQSTNQTRLIQSAVLCALGFAVTVTAISLKGQSDPTEPTRPCDLHFSNGYTLAGVPVAETVAQHTKGLSKRNDVWPGMLFTWPEPEPRIFWMRDTWIPLTIGFFDGDGRLFAIEDMQPNTDDHHASVHPAADALELPQGDFQRYGLQAGVSLTGRTCWLLDDEAMRKLEAE